MHSVLRPSEVHVQPHVTNMPNLGGLYAQLSFLIDTAFSRALYAGTMVWVHRLVTNASLSDLSSSGRMTWVHREPEERQLDRQLDERTHLLLNGRYVSLRPTS